MKKVKEKKCKNPWCGKWFTPYYTSLQPACSPTCALQLSRHLEKKRLEKNWREEKKALKEELKTLTEHEKEARKPFQKWIRWRDRDKPCISCDAKTAKQWDGGHLFKAEIYSGLIFNENNCHKQCSRCNDIYSGNELAYREGLIRRYGEQYVKDLELIKDALRNKKYTREELIEIKNEYHNRLKAIKEK